MAKGKVSGKTHTQEQLNDWANQHNPNNSAYNPSFDNPKTKTHQQRHNAQRRTSQPWPDWAPDYPDYDD